MNIMYWNSTKEIFIDINFKFLSFHHTKPFNSTFKRKMTSTTTITTASAVKEDAFAILHNINESLPSIYILEMQKVQKYFSASNHLHKNFVCCVKWSIIIIIGNFSFAQNVLF